MADHIFFEFFVHGFAFGEFLLQVNDLVFQTFIHNDPKLRIPFQDRFRSLSWILQLLKDAIIWSTR